MGDFSSGYLVRPTALEGSKEGKILEIVHNNGHIAC
jgi:hypothetical protein